MGLGKRLADVVKPYLQLLRVSNLTFLAILLFAMEQWVAVPLLRLEHLSQQMPLWVFVLLLLSTLLIAAGGYVINDYFDVKIDRINRPDDIVVTRHISRDGAMQLFKVLSGLGIVTGLIVTWWAKSWTLMMIFLVIPGLLWFYSASYKRQFLVGNLVVAFVSGLVPLLVAIANADYLSHLYGTSLTYTPIIGQLYVWLGGFAVFAFLITLAREITKDIEDIEGDCEMECRTIPIVWGVRTSKIIITILLLLTFFLIVYLTFAVLPFPHDWQSFSIRYIVFGILTPIICSIILLWSAKTKQEIHRTQVVLKFAMFLGTMYSFVIHQNLTLCN